MKIKTEKTITEFIEVEIPIYKKHGCHFYKIFSEEHCIGVTDLDNHLSIGVHHASLAFVGNQTEDCTKEEFENKLEEVKEKLIALGLKDALNTKL